MTILAAREPREVRTEQQACGVRAAGVLVGSQDNGAVRLDVRLWHLADIHPEAGHVRSWGVKRTSLIAAVMSANDPKRTSRPVILAHIRRGAHDSTTIVISNVPPPPDAG
jgi:hypothetical protein